MNTQYIYKIAPSSPKPSYPDPTANTGRSSSSSPILPTSDLDTSSNFIHMSTAVQIPGTLKHFFPTDSLENNSVYLLKLPLQPLEDAGVVRWESPDARICGPREGEGMFPHLYFDGLEETTTGERTTTTRRLWLKRSEVEDVVGVTSKVGSTGWEEGLKGLKGWLV